MNRAQAFETDDYALRCYIDQLPVDRCLFCARPTQPRQIHVAGPVHRWSNLNEMADTGDGWDKLAVAGAILSRGRGVVAHSQQTKGTVSMAVCMRCAPSPKVPLIVGASLLGVTALFGLLHMILLAVLAGLAMVVALVIASKRQKLSVGEIDEDDFMFKIQGVDDGVKAEVLALGAAPHPANKGNAQLRA